MCSERIMNAFMRLREEHATRGVHWRFAHKAFGLEWAFHSFGRDKKITPKGAGAKAFKEVCELADQFGITLSLWCIPKLRAYYAAFGFVLRNDNTDFLDRRVQCLALTD